MKYKKRDRFAFTKEGCIGSGQKIKVVKVFKEKQLARPYLIEWDCGEMQKVSDDILDSEHYTKLKPKKKNKLKKRVKELEDCELDVRVTEIIKRIDSLTERLTPIEERLKRFDEGMKLQPETPHKHVITADKTLEERLEELGCAKVNIYKYTGNELGETDVEIEFEGRQEQQGELRFDIKKYTPDEIVEKVKNIIEILK